MSLDEDASLRGAASDAPERARIRSIATEPGAGATAGSRVPEADRRSRWRELDGLRAVAVTLVLVYHLVIAAYPVVPPRALSRLLHLNAGVELFFVLSGFLIYSPFVRAHLAGEPLPSPRSYALRRVLRIYPGYLVALGVLWVLGWVTLRSGSGPVANVLLVQGYVRPPGLDHSGIPPAWTLCVEVSFYAFVPLWAIAIRACRGRRVLATELAGAGLLMALGPLALWAQLEGALARPFTVLAPHLGALAGGMALAILVAARADRPRLDRLLPRVAPPVACWALALVALLVVTDGLGSVDSDVAVRVLTALCHTGFALLAAAPVVLGSASPTAIGRVLRSRPFVWTGVVSYGIYLWHYDLIENLWPRRLTGTLGVATVAGAGVAAVSVAVGALSYHVVERPLLDRIRRPPAPPRLPDPPPPTIDLRHAGS